MTTLTIHLDGEQLAELADMVARRVAAQFSTPASTPNVPRWLNTREAAEHVAMNRSEVHRAAAAGAIPHEQDAPGCALRFRVAELDEWIRAGRPGLARRAGR